MMLTSCRNFRLTNLLLEYLCFTCTVQSSVVLFWFIDGMVDGDCLFPDKECVLCGIGIFQEINRLMIKGIQPLPLILAHFICIFVLLTLHDILPDKPWVSLLFIFFSSGVQLEFYSFPCICFGQGWRSLLFSACLMSFFHQPVVSSCKLLLQVPHIWLC